MTTYYAGVGGNDANNGTSYALRKLTIQAAVNLATTAGDQVLVSPGTYRETVTMGSSGSGGSPISLIGDYTGVNTSGVRGVVRITGSNDDITATRTSPIIATTKNYITISGFVLDGGSQYCIGLTDCTNIIIEKCYIAESFGLLAGIYCAGASQAAITIRRCIVYASQYAPSIQFTHSATVSNAAHVVENCILNGGNDLAVFSVLRVGGITLRNSVIQTGIHGVYVSSALAGGQTVNVNNCIITRVRNALNATATGEITENYNTIFGATTARTNTSTGANSVTRPPLFDTRWFFEAVNSGKLITPFDLASYSTLVEYNSGTGAPSTDMRGAAATGTYREWGALEYNANLSRGIAPQVIGSPIVRGLGAI